MGKLREVSSAFKSSPREVNPLVTTENEDYECTAKYSDMQSGAFTWVIGNCAKGAILEAVVRRLYSDSEPEGNYALGGWVGGGFQGCGWVEDEKFKPKAKKSKPTTTCSEISSGKYEVAESLFMSKHNGGAGDGYFVVNKASCPEYANYRPWSSNNVEKELIRTAPAYATSGTGSNYPALKWRYTTKYNSTDGTGQYVMVRDDRLSAGEGNWVFVPRSCLPATLPENENERVPSPPTVSTGGTSNLAPQGVTLHGTVNPNGLETKYHFEYWATGSPVSTPEGSAGSGTSSVEEAASVGLQPGTTYHYRFIATSATGTGTGSENTFTTPCFQPEVITTAPTAVQQTQATLTGSLNPRECDTKYYYRYGVTTSYESSTPETDAGAGTSTVQVPVTVTGLEPGTTYHYRLVAKSLNGQLTEGSDQVFSTQSAEYVFYRGTDGGLKNWYWSGSSWEFGSIGSVDAVEGNPSVVLSSEGRKLGRGIVDVFYRGTDGGLKNWYWNGSAWSYGPIGEAKVMAGDPHAIALPEGHIDVFYRGTNGGLQNQYWNGSTWSPGAIGSEKAMTGEPSPIALPEGHIDVFYRGTNGGLQNQYWSSPSWTYAAIGSEKAMAGDPRAIALPEGHIDVFYRGTNGGLQNQYWNGSTWSPGAIGSEKAMTGEPSAVALPEGHIDVFYRGTNNGLQNWYWGSPTWTYGAIGSENTMVGGPDAVTWPNGNMDVFYRGPNEVLENWFWSAPYWSFGSLGGEKAIAGEPSVVAW